MIQSVAALSLSSTPNLAGRACFLPAFCGKPLRVITTEPAKTIFGGSYDNPEAHSHFLQHLGHRSFLCRLSAAKRERKHDRNDYRLAAGRTNLNAHPATAKDRRHD